MADQYFKDTTRTTDSTEATGSMASSASPPGLANKVLSSDASATAMAKFSLDLRDLEAAAVLEAMGRVPETQWPGTEASTLEMSTDSEVTFRKVLGSAEVLPTRPGVDPLEVTRPMADVSWTSQSPQATSPSVITRQPTRTSPGPWPPVASHVFGPSTTQVDPDSPDRGSRQTTNWLHTEDARTFHTQDDPGSSPWQDPRTFRWFPHSEFRGPAVHSDVCNVSQGTIRPTVGISHNVVAPSRAVDVDTRIEPPSQPHFVAADTRKFLPIHVDVHAEPSSPLSSCVDSHTKSKRLYAAAHTPLAPPTTPIADLLRHERNLMSSTSTDSDSDCPPTASQRENRPPVLGTHSCPPSSPSVASSVRSIASRSLYQLTQLATQLVTTVKDQLKSTRDDAEMRDQRMFNEIAEREHRLLADAADRESRLLSAAAERDRRAGELEVQREQILVRDAQSARQELLVEIQLQRDREAQREIDMRRDMYDLAAQRSRAAALEAELKCLKANISQSTVAYEVIDVPVQSADIAPLESTTAVPMSPTRPATPIDNYVVQGLPANMTQRQPSIVYRPDIAHSLTSNPRVADTEDISSCHGADISTSRPQYTFFAMNESTVRRTDTQCTQLSALSNPGYMPYHESDTLPRQPALVDPSPHSEDVMISALPHQSDTLSRRPPVTTVSDPVHSHMPEHTFPRWYWAEYTRFSISDEVDNCRLTVSGYSGDAGNALIDTLHTRWRAKGRRFSTSDIDNDAWPRGSCAVERGGGWWFNRCSTSNLNTDGVTYWTTDAARTDVLASRMLIKVKPAVITPPTPSPGRLC